MPFLPPATLPGVAPSGSGGTFVATNAAARVPQTTAAPGVSYSTAFSRLAPVLGTDRAAPGGMLGRAMLGEPDLGGSTIGTSSGGGGSGSAGSVPVGEGETDVPAVGGEEVVDEEVVDENGDDVSTALGTSIGAALRGSLVPLAIGAGVGLLLGFALSR